MTTTGALIVESLRVGTVLSGVTLQVSKVSRADLGDTSAGQPLTWTFVHFDIADDDAEQLAAQLEQALEPGPWYCDFHSGTDTFVVFAGRTFCYPRGDHAGRAVAADHARSVGVPEAQIDWSE